MLIKRSKVANWIERKDLFAVYKDSGQKDTKRLKVKQWKKVFHANIHRNNIAGMAKNQISSKNVYKRQGSTYTDKNFSTERGHNGHKHICTQQQSPQIYEPIMDRLE